MESLGRHVSRFLRFLQDKAGVSAVEYALIIVAVIAVMGVGATALTDGFTDLFTDLENELTGATT